MASIPLMQAPKEIFDDLDNRWKLFRAIALFGLLMIICLLVVLHSNFHSNDLSKARGLQLCWLLLAAGVLRLPFLLRDWFKSFWHEPALRLDDRGIWSREWSSLGTMEWADIRSLYLDIASEKSTVAQVVASLRNEGKYLSRLGWSESLSLAVSRFLDMYFGTSTKDPLVLLLALLPIDRAKAEMDPVLAAYGLPPLAGAVPNGA